MRILVFGASGQTGLAFLEQALEQGHLLTAFTRQPAKIELRAPALRVVQGNVNDAEAVSAVMPEHDAVVCTLGVGTPLQHDQAVIDGVRHILQAAEAHNVRRLIYLSFIGVHASRAAVGFVLRFIAPIPLRHEIADHEAKEALVMASALDWTIVRPPKMTNGARTGGYRAGSAITSWLPVPMLSRADVADFMLAELTNPNYVRQAVRLLH